MIFSKKLEIVNREKRNSGPFKIHKIVSLFEPKSDLNTIVLYIYSDSTTSHDRAKTLFRTRQGNATDSVQI